MPKNYILLLLSRYQQDMEKLTPSTINLCCYKRKNPVLLLVSGKYWHEESKNYIVPDDKILTITPEISEQTIESFEMISP